MPCKIVIEFHSHVLSVFSLNLSNAQVPEKKATLASKPKAKKAGTGVGGANNKTTKAKGKSEAVKARDEARWAFHPEFHHLHHFIVVTLARVCSIKSFIQSYVTTFTAYYHCYMTLSITNSSNSTSVSKLYFFSIFRKKMLEDRKRAMKEKKAENQDDLVIIM